MIYATAFVNDYIVRRMIFSKFNILVHASFISQWKKRHSLSSVKPSYSRVAAFNEHSEWIERQYLRSVKDAFSEYDHDNIMNADETFCRTFPHSVAKVYGFTNNRREGRRVHIDVDDKQGITCMSTITASGRSLSPFFVKKGKSTRCIRDILADAVLATFSDNGWMNEDVAIQYIDQVLAPHLNGRPGCLIWDIFRAHVTPSVKKHLEDNNIKPVYVPASLTWKRQPLDTHIFAVLKKKYAAFYYDRVFVERIPIKQIDTIYAYNNLMLNIDKKHIIAAFQEAILNDAKFVLPIDRDPNPKMDVESSEKSELDEEESEVDIVSQYEEQPLEEETSEDELVLPEEMPNMRRPRQAHNLAYDARMAQIHQASMNKH